MGLLGVLTENRRGLTYRIMDDPQTTYKVLPILSDSFMEAGPQSPDFKILLFLCTLAYQKIPSLQTPAYPKISPTAGGRVLAGVPEEGLQTPSLDSKNSITIGLATTLVLC